ncbi:MAG TPA: hypothetical protein VGF56_08850 [Rhizomicrobium sp.]|jgi:hypothetical protein
MAPETTFPHGSRETAYPFSIVPRGLSQEIASKYRGKKSQRHACGAYLRFQIPEVLARNSIDEVYSLYVDVDCFFLNALIEPTVQPIFFAGCPDIRMDNWKFINSGVLLLNNRTMRVECEPLLDHARNHSFDFEFSRFGPCDQGALNTFLSGRWERLGLEYNWKPFWGISESAVIAHFVGPNVFEAASYLSDDSDVVETYWSGTHRRFVARNPAAYFYFLLRWLTVAQTLVDDLDRVMQLQIADLTGRLEALGASGRDLGLVP